MSESITGVGSPSCSVAIDTLPSTFGKQKGKLTNKEAREAKDAATSINHHRPELCEEGVRLAIKSSLGFKEVNKFKKYLKTVENLRILSDGWSEDEGITIILSMQNPITLSSVLNEMPIVEKVCEKSKNLLVVLKNSEIN